ncbi:hypothetical protein GGQ92_000365 [Gracilibacillus halotolerans]|uniref:YolD-like protein n=1 Tax=Gracilibacillus halotolerans TaxID=74386 RepID=A0A841RLJ3_9BACI|nr:YolD-like family protein [Gracilibacillus halotolerans]MBB6511598.1 hypothetical protein [Gracilibacillus halotolerans]
MVNDRGNMKWASLMLPEHVESLQELFQENRIKKPILSEDKKEEIEYKLRKAIDTKLSVNITYFTQYKLAKVEGVITSFHPLQRILRIQCLDNEIINIPITDICDVNY